MESQDIDNHHFGAVAKAALGSFLIETQCWSGLEKHKLKCNISTRVASKSTGFRNSTK